MSTQKVNASQTGQSRNESIMKDALIFRLATTGKYRVEFLQNSTLATLRKLVNEEQLICFKWDVSTAHLYDGRIGEKRC